MRSHGFALVACSVAAIGCATTRGSAGAAVQPPAPMAVAASSMPSAYGIQLRLEGSAIVRDGWLYVVVPTGSVRTYQGSADVWDLMVRAGLAVCDGHGEWRLVSESRAARIAPLVGFTRDSAVLDTTVRVFSDTLRLDLGVPKAIAMDQLRLTFEPVWPVGGALATYVIPARVTVVSSSGVVSSIGIVSSNGTTSPTGVRGAGRSSRSRCSA